ncbi:(2Fe-2S)-binding protein [Saccharomonospora piscinae]|uniref:(2Fe-2S)-binding protein n=1 Tax=Saccharomonospora piscinae TaxID=687388 RepID=UPI00110649C2|nr:(2Fe-2S)-binding protein [Saccharomonospora piscinae]TLW90907.1 (2Fe-2S)-binding protein [Saccharomonospora piscinae]
MGVPATVLTDPTWLAEDLRRARTLYGPAPRAVLGTVRWYSASSVLVAAALEPWVHTGLARDPALDAVRLDLADGRFLDASSTRGLGPDPADLGAALVRAVDAAVTAFAAACGARERALWAVAVDSIANRLLWAASATGADHVEGVRLAGELAEHMARAAHDVPGCRWRGSPRPRFTTVGDRVIVRRVSCCLIYETPTAGEVTCVSCPRQTPAERERRVRGQLSG